jgi:hypothetical protein
MNSSTMIDLNFSVIVDRWLVDQSHYRIRCNRQDDWIILIVRFSNFAMNLWKIAILDNGRLNDDIYYCVNSMESMHNNCDI